MKQGIDPKTTYYDGSEPAILEIPGGGGTWDVHNSEAGNGVMSLEEATWNSVNIVYAKLDLDVGPENVTQTAEEMGIEAELLSVPAEAIGGLSHGVSPLEQADGYATLANGGVHHDPTAISKVEFPEGKVDEIESEEGNRALDPGAGLGGHQRAQRRDHAGHRQPATPNCRTAPKRPARPAPPTKNRTPGSSATRRNTRPRSGSAIRAPTNTPASVARPRGRSGKTSWNRRRRASARPSKNRRASPNSPP